MQLTSPAFKDKETIPTKYVMPGAGGKNVSIPLEWSDIPQGTHSFALSMIDPHPVANNWIHWLVINLPSDTTSLQEGASGTAMRGAQELRNSFGATGYGGPQPPAGSGAHPYVIALYALNVPAIDLPIDSTLTQFELALRDKTVAQATLTGMFEK